VHSVVSVLARFFGLEIARVTFGNSAMTKGEMLNQVQNDKYSTGRRRAIAFGDVRHPNHRPSTQGGGFLSVLICGERFLLWLSFMPFSVVFFQHDSQILYKALV